MALKAHLLILVLLIDVFLVGGVVDAQEDITLPEPTAQVASGDSITGELAADAPVLVYSFDGSVGDIVGINVEFDELDGYIWLVDPSGDVIARNDDRSSIFTSGLPAFQLPEEGTYGLAVSTYSYVTAGDTSVSGAFTLTLSTPEVRNLEVGNEAQGEIDQAGAEVLYFVEAAAGQILSVAAQSDTFDTRLFLDPAAGQNVRQWSNDDFGNSTNSQIGPALIPESGRYVVTITSVFDDEMGAFSLLLTALSPTPLESGATARGTLTLEDSTQFYEFMARAGASIRIIAEAAGTMQLTLELFSSDAESLAYNEGGSRANTTLDYVPEANGTYVVRVSPAGSVFDESSLGAFTITVTAGR